MRLYGFSHYLDEGDQLICPKLTKVDFTHGSDGGDSFCGKDSRMFNPLQLAI